MTDKLSQDSLTGDFNNCSKGVLSQVNVSNEVYFIARGISYALIEFTWGLNVHYKSSSSVADQNFLTQFSEFLS